jgi:F-type H+-transporting ATPase subunit gamma
MPSLKDIRSRIDSTKNTQQITRAMKMTSAAKLRRAQINIVNLRPYAQTLLSLIADISVTKRVEHPLLQTGVEAETSAGKKLLLVVLTSDRGLCGAFNTNISKTAERFVRNHGSKYSKIDYFFVGRKGSDYFRRRDVKPVETILNLAKDVSFTMASGVAETLMNAFMAGHYDEIRVIYNEFKSAIQQEVISETLLPIDVEKAATLGKGTGGFPTDMIFEPEPEMMIDDLIKKHFHVQVYRCMSESVASEHGARMTAMENATKNAGEMISLLTLTYNKLRQASITTELIEIVSGAEALKG